MEDKTLSQQKAQLDYSLATDDQIVKFIENISKTNSMLSVTYEREIVGLKKKLDEAYQRHQDLERDIEILKRKLNPSGKSKYANKKWKVTYK